jgi:hypothetical protein
VNRPALNPMAGVRRGRRNGRRAFLVQALVIGAGAADLTAGHARGGLAEFCAVCILLCLGAAVFTAITLRRSKARWPR